MLCLIFKTINTVGKYVCSLPRTEATAVTEKIVKEYMLQHTVIYEDRQENMINIQRLDRELEELDSLLAVFGN